MRKRLRMLAKEWYACPSNCYPNSNHAPPLIVHGMLLGRSLLLICLFILLSLKQTTYNGIPVTVSLLKAIGDSLDEKAQGQYRAARDLDDELLSMSECVRATMEYNSGQEEVAQRILDSFYKHNVRRGALSNVVAKFDDTFRYVRLSEVRFRKILVVYTVACMISHFQLSCDDLWLSFIHTHWIIIVMHLVHISSLGRWFSQIRLF